MTDNEAHANPILSEGVSPSDRRQFLEKDYDLKIKYLSDHYTRMWARCNFFVGLESALTVALFGWFKDRGGFSPAAWPIGVTGAVLSAWWYCFGAQDRYLAEVYRKQVALLGRILTDVFVPEGFSGAAGGYTHVGDTASEQARVSKNFYQWRFNLISTTKLAVWFPVLTFIFWIVMLVLIRSYINQS
jgi:hypothetical protein